MGSPFKKKLLGLGVLGHSSQDLRRYWEWQHWLEYSCLLIASENKQTKKKLSFFCCVVHSNLTGVINKDDEKKKKGIVFVFALFCFEELLLCYTLIFFFFSFSFRASSRRRFSSNGVARRCRSRQHPPYPDLWQGQSWRCYNSSSVCWNHVSSNPTCCLFRNTTRYIWYHISYFSMPLSLQC